jgi:subtilisin family serine protease
MLGRSTERGYSLRSKYLLSQFLDDFDLANSGISLNVKIGLSFDIRQKFNIFNGVSIKVKSDHTGDDLAAMEGVKRVWPVELVQLPTPEFSKENLAQPFLTSAHKMTGVDYVQQKFKYTGEGIRVGIIDTGVDYKHPALGGCFGKGCRVEFGWDFLGDKYEQTSIPAGDDGMSIATSRYDLLWRPE